MNDSLGKLGVPIDKIGVLVIDHGSRRDESNQVLLEVVDLFRKHSSWTIVQPAHMELAEPSIAMAFDMCVARGAELVIAFPYFLAPGKHWHEDIPHLVAEAAKSHDNVQYLITEPLGLHPLILEVIDERISSCLQIANAAANKR